MLLNVSDFANLQAALDTAVDGDRIYLPSSGSPYSPVSPNTGWIINKGIEVFGDGPGIPEDDSGTTLANHGTQASTNLLTVQAPATGTLAPVYIHDLKLKGSGGPTVNNGIACAPTSGQTITALRLDRVVVLSMATSAFAINPAAQAGTIEKLTMLDCYGLACGGIGLIVTNVRRASLIRCGYGSNSGGGVKAEGTAITLRVVAHEADGASPTATLGELQLVACPIAHVEACRFERYNLGTKALAVEFKSCGGAGLLAASSFVIPDPDPALPPPSTTGVVIAAPAAPYISVPSGPIAILANEFTKVQPMLINVSATAPGNMLCPQFSDVRAYHPTDGTIVVGGGINGLVAVPYVASNPAGRVLPAGLAIPVRTGPPTTGVQSGVMYYDGAQGLLRVRIGTTWKSVKTV